VCVCVCVCVGPKMHCPGVHPFSLSLALVVPTFNRLTVSFTAGDFRTEKDRMRVGGGGTILHMCHHYHYPPVEEDFILRV
jgi:hypothetical protein